VEDDSLYVDTMYSTAVIDSFVKDDSLYIDINDYLVGNYQITTKKVNKLNSFIKNSSKIGKSR